MSNFERKYGGFILLYVFAAMMLAISAIPFATSAWWVVPVMTAPIVLFTVAMAVGVAVALFLAALEDYRRASNQEDRP